MSLDITLTVTKWESYNSGKTWTEQEVPVYEGNITHNLTRMAEACRLYEVMWRPEGLLAGDIIPSLEKGLDLLKSDPDKFKQYDSDNGWGKYKDFVPFVEEYLNTCKKYPQAKIEVSR